MVHFACYDCTDVTVYESNTIEYVEPINAAVAKRHDVTTHSLTTI